MATVPLQYERIVQESLGSRLSSSLKAHRTLEFTTSVMLNMAGSISSGASLQSTNNQIGRLIEASKINVSSVASDTTKVHTCIPMSGTQQQPPM